MATRLFGAYVVADWTAAEGKKTGEQSLWIGVMTRDVRFRLKYETHNPATRAEGLATLRTILSDLRRRGDRVFLGFDFSLGFPNGTAERAGLKGEPWSAAWSFLAKEIVDKPDNTNNRFQVAAKLNRLTTDAARPFWGAPARQTQRWLQSTKPVGGYGDVPEFRLTELAAKRGKVQPKSVWQLQGAGAVGGQTLVGIAALKKLIDELGPTVAVWPFGTGWRALSAADVEPLAVLVAEVYPSLYLVEPKTGEVKDAAQVRTVCEAVAELDDKGRLGAAFGPAKPPSDEERAIVEREEGWIFGA